MDYSPPGSSVHGDPPGRNTGVGCCARLQGDLPSPGIKLISLEFCIAGRFFTHWATWEARGLRCQEAFPVSSLILSFQLFWATERVSLHDLVLPWPWPLCLLPLLGLQCGQRCPLFLSSVHLSLTGLLSLWNGVSEQLCPIPMAATRPLVLAGKYLLPCSSNSMPPWVRQLWRAPGFLLLEAMTLTFHPGNGRGNSSSPTGRWVWLFFLQKLVLARLRELGGEHFPILFLWR